MGDPSWLRLTDLWTTAAKSVFQFNVQGQVATSTDAGLPWLRYLREQCGSKLHFWPFEGWETPFGSSASSKFIPRSGRGVFRARGTATSMPLLPWLQRADLNGPRDISICRSHRRAGNREGRGVDFGGCEDLPQMPAAPNGQPFVSLAKQR